MCGIPAFKNDSCWDFRISLFIEEIIFSKEKGTSRNISNQWADQIASRVAAMVAKAGTEGEGWFLERTVRVDIAICNSSVDISGTEESINVFHTCCQIFNFKGHEKKKWSNVFSEWMQWGQAAEGKWLGINLFSNKRYGILPVKNRYQIFLHFWDIGRRQNFFQSIFKSGENGGWKCGFMLSCDVQI